MGLRGLLRGKVQEYQTRQREQAADKQRYDQIRKTEYAASKEQFMRREAAAAGRRDAYHEAKEHYAPKRQGDGIGDKMVRYSNTLNQFDPFGMSPVQAPRRSPRRAARRHAPQRRRRRARARYDQAQPWEQWW